ncbi:MAG: Uma2 family endonuclease [Gemmataceae bacterium]
MKTAIKRFGPADHGRPVGDEEAANARYKEGYLYEVIEGRLYVSPAPNPPESYLNEWLKDKLKAYEVRRPEVVNFVAGRTRVFLPDRELTTCPEPDVAVYHSVPLDKSIRSLRWEDLSPVIVAEVLVDSEPFKDLVRNVGLYVQVPSIREYWILDGSDDPDEPTLIVYRRRGTGWQKRREYRFGSTYTTPFLPGFRLVIDPHR